VQFPNGSFPKVRLGLLRRRRLQWGSRAAARISKGPSATARTGHGGPSSAAKDRLEKFPLGKLHIWEVATWKNTLGKLPLEKMPLGK